MGDWMLLEMMATVKPRPGVAVSEIVETVEVEVKYFTTTNAKTYHKRDCFSIRNAAELIELTAEEAEASGRKACGNCLA